MTKNNDWVTCPICDEDDMQKAEGQILCTNINCGGNGGTNFAGVKKAEIEPTADNPSYYDEGKTAEFFEGLSNKDLSAELIQAGHELTDMDIEAVEKWIPIVALISIAGDRLAKLTGARPYDHFDTLSRLDGALCNYLNGIADPYEPKESWDEETWKNRKELNEAYNQAHTVGLFTLETLAPKEA